MIPWLPVPVLSPPGPRPVVSPVVLTTLPGVFFPTTATGRLATGDPLPCLLCLAAVSRRQVYMIRLASSGMVPHHPLSQHPPFPQGMPPAGIPATGIPPGGMPATGIPPAGIPAAGMPATGVPAAGMPAAGVPSSAMPQAGMPTAPIPAPSNRSGMMDSTGEQSGGMNGRRVPVSLHSPVHFFFFFSSLFFYPTDGAGKNYLATDESGR